MIRQAVAIAVLAFAVACQSPTTAQLPQPDPPPPSQLPTLTFAMSAPEISQGERCQFDIGTNGDRIALSVDATVLGAWDRPFGSPETWTVVVNVYPAITTTYKATATNSHGATSTTRTVVVK